MLHTIDEGFAALLSKLQDSPSKTGAAARQLLSIEEKLEQSLGITEFFRIGSFESGTSIRGYSDVDYFAVIPRGRRTNDSNASLCEVAAALRERLPTNANIRVSSPGVRISFGLVGAEATQVVPVDHTGRTALGFRQFDMPDGFGGWKSSAPECHQAYVAGIDQKHAGRAKPLIRLIKAWKYFWKIPIRSFYLERMTAQFADNESIIIYDIDVAYLLDWMLRHALPDIEGPRFTHHSPAICPCDGALQQQYAVGNLGNVTSWAREARRLVLNGSHAQAFERWNLVYNHNFPDWG